MPKSDYDDGLRKERMAAGTKLIAAFCEVTNQENKDLYAEEYAIDAMTDLLGWAVSKGKDADQILEFVAMHHRDELAA